VSKDIKFKLTAESKINAFGVKLFRIEATVDIKSRGVSKGDKGGWLSSEKLDNGNARVSGNAWVFGDAQVFGDARVFGDAQVFGDAWVFGNARVFGDAQVFGDAWVFGDARVSGNAWVFGDAQVSGNAWVFGNARVFGDAQVFGDARVSLKKAYTKGNFLYSSDKQIKIEIVDQSKDDNFDDSEDYKYLLVVGDYEIIDIDPPKNNEKENLLSKADELIAKAEELKEQAEKL